MCAHTVIFLHDVEEGPRGLRFLSFVNTTPTRGEKLIFPQNVAKFWRTKWGGQVEFEIDQITGLCLKTRGVIYSLHVDESEISDFIFAI